MKRLHILLGVLLICLPFTLNAAVTIELINTAAAGVFPVEGVPVTMNSAALSSQTATRHLVAGNVIMFGRLPSGTINLNVPVKAIRWEAGWAILTTPYSFQGKPATLDIYLFGRTPTNRGQIKVAVMQGEGEKRRRVGDFLYPRKPYDQLYVATFTSGSGVSVTHFAQ